jgi:hypothetical protein
MKRNINVLPDFGRKICIDRTGCALAAGNGSIFAMYTK